MTGLPADVWVPTEIPWKLVRVGDVVVGSTSDTDESELWQVESIYLDGTNVLVAVCGHRGKSYPIDRDTPVRVLAEAPRAALSDADAADIIRAQIACTLISRRDPHTPAA